MRNGNLLKSCDSEICVIWIRVNQGVGVLATRVKILRAAKAAAKKNKKNSQIPFWIGHPVTPTFEPLSSQGCHLYITLWHMWMHVNTRKTKTGCSKNTDASRPAANTLINLLRFYLIKNVKIENLQQYPEIRPWLCPEKMA